ncbi:IS66 family transposase, partial [Flavobacterium sp. IR1]
MKTTETTSRRTTEELEERVSSLEKQNAELTAKIKWFEEQFRLSKQRQFGTSSEKTNADQLELPLFNEAEISADPTIEEPTVETITYKRKKTKGQRDIKLENLPKEIIEYRLPEEDQVCSCCNGNLHEMSTEIRRELKVIPAEVKVIEHVQLVYSCRHCGRKNIETPIVKASMPK